MKENVAYMGDDIPDICVLEKVGLASCPNDAVKEVQERLKLGKNNTYKLINKKGFPKIIIGKKILIPEEQFEKYMMATGEMATDVGTILYGKEAVSSGLIDRLGGLSDALSALHKMIDKARKKSAE